MFTNHRDDNDSDREESGTNKRRGRDEGEEEERDKEEDKDEEGRMDERELQEEGEEKNKEGDEESEEVRRPKILRNPEEPTTKEREDHMKVYIPYRTWCRICVKGRGRDRPHRTVIRNELGISIIGIDYFFISDEDDVGTVYSGRSSPRRAWSLTR